MGKDCISLQGEAYVRCTVVHIEAGLQPAQGKLKRNSNRGLRNGEEDPLQGAGLVVPRAWAPGPTTLHARRAGVAAAVEHGCSQCLGAVQALVRWSLARWSADSQGFLWSGSPVWKNWKTVGKMHLMLSGLARARCQLTEWVKECASYSSTHAAKHFLDGRSRFGHRTLFATDLWLALVWPHLLCVCFSFLPHLSTGFEHNRVAFIYRLMMQQLDNWVPNLTTSFKSGRTAALWVHVRSVWDEVEFLCLEKSHIFP